MGTRRYRANTGQDVPLTDILTRHAGSDKTAVIEGERAFSYRQLNEAADNNPGLQFTPSGHQTGETLWCNWEYCGTAIHITFFALLKLGVAPVLALFGQHYRSNAYAMQDRADAVVTGIVACAGAGQGRATGGGRAGRGGPAPPYNGGDAKRRYYRRKSLFPVPITTIITTACAAAMRFTVSTRRRVFCARFPPRTASAMSSPRRAGAFSRQRNGR